MERAMTQDDAIVSGATAGLRMLADGTIRLSVDFEPGDAQAAMQLFGKIGQPLGVAALKVGHAAAGAKKDDPRGPLCMEAISLCANQKFQEWIAHAADAGFNWKPTADAAKGFILSRCGVESRKELDESHIAANLFRNITRAFQEWVRNVDRA
jgi:hypothetical protein